MMTPGRRAHRRPYFVELFALANLVAIFIFARGNLYVLLSAPITLALFVPTLALYALIGVGLRVIVAAFRGNARDYLRIIRTPGWLTDTLRLALFGALVIHTYAWIKLLVPLLHPVLYDQQLWDLEQALSFGYSPNILLLNLLSNRGALAFIDWSYAKIFMTSMTVAYVFFLSAESRRLRIAFLTGSAYLWLFGAWLYMAIPSLGPALRFPEIWAPFADSLAMTLNMQTVAMKNYAQVLRLPFGTAKIDQIQLLFGVAAFPSLHVGFQAFAFLWMRRIWITGQVIFGVFVFVILIGSVVTGWHYLVDGIAGMLLAWLSYSLASRGWRIQRWLHLAALVRR